MAKDGIERALIRYRALGIFALLVGSAACAHVHKLTATPGDACPGGEVTVTWDAFGSTTLTSAPILTGTGRQKAQGSRTFQISETTRFTLTAHHLLCDDSAEADVVVTGPDPLGFGDIAQCDDGRRLLSASVELDSQVAPNLDVDSIRNPGQRPLVVSKDDVNVSLPAGAKSGPIERLRARGTWSLESPLEPGETCERALRSVRQRLQFEFQPRCGG
jgi:hypothetical protein